MSKTYDQYVAHCKSCNERVFLSRTQFRVRAAYIAAVWNMFQEEQDSMCETDSDNLVFEYSVHFRKARKMMRIVNRSKRFVKKEAAAKTVRVVITQPRPRSRFERSRTHYGVIIKITVPK